MATRTRHSANWSETDIWQSDGNFSSYSMLLPPEHANIRGNEHDNELQGTKAADTIRGNGGNDTLSGLTGNDQLFGDSGRDVLNGGGGDDRLHGGAAFDQLLGGNGDDVLKGGGANDHLFGVGGDDKLFGNAGDDTFNGAGGVNQYFGGSGNDTYYISARRMGGDTVSETKVGGGDAGGFDVVESDRNFTLPAFVEQLNLHGTARYGAGNDTDNTIIGDGHGNHLLGMGGNDQLAGSFRDDVLNGGDGDDTIAGGDDNDRLTGGTGHDKFIFAPGQGIDKITDFSTTDDQFVFSRAAWNLPGDAAPADYVVIDKDADTPPVAPDSAHGYFLASDNAVWFDDDGNGANEPVKIVDYNRSDGSLTLNSFGFVA